MKLKTLVITLLILALYILHQDFWNWKKADPLVFGFLPIGLAYHAGFSIACAILMGILVKLAWPKHLEEVPPAEVEAKQDQKEPH